MEFGKNRIAIPAEKNKINEMKVEILRIKIKRKKINK